MTGLPIANARPELRLAIDAVLKAGKAVMEEYAGKFATDTKSDGSPVTTADIKSNRILGAALEGSGYHILSEEDCDEKSRLKQERIWIIDPLDGTSDFVGYTGEFTIMVALVERKMPVIGVISWPAGDTLFVAQRGAGAFRLVDGVWSQMHVTGETELQRCRAVGSRNHLTDYEREFFEKIGVLEFTSVGSSLKVARISNGEAEMYVTTTDKMKEWDTCASFCIINEAGGKMTDCLGNTLTYNNEYVGHPHGIIASNGHVHEAIIESLKSK